MHLNYHVSDDVMKSPLVVDVSNGMFSFYGYLLVEEDVDVNVWWYGYYTERQYAAHLCDLRAGFLDSCSGRYMVHSDSIGWEWAIFPSMFG